jgi:aryl-alcohol dehydrogenase-like predicted oxidoreductase
VVETRTLGRSGLQVSLAGLGCNNFGMRLDDDASRAVLDAAFDEGITFFDTADIYGGGKSEEVMGEVLQGRRSEVIIGTKAGMASGAGPYRKGASRWYLQRQVEQSLRRLRTDYIDLFQLHQPDPHTPIEETLGVLSDLVHQGKIRYIGSSNFAGWQVADAEWTSRHHHLERFVSVQNEWSLLNRAIEAEVVPAAHEFGVGVLPYFPLASGVLTGKYTRGEAFPEGTRMAAMGKYMGHMASDANLAAVDRLRAWADAHDRAVGDVALSWLASQPVVSSVIAGATSPEQVKSNVAGTRADLTPEEVAEVAAIVSGGEGAAA